MTVEDVMKSILAVTLVLIAAGPALATTIHAQSTWPTDPKVETAVLSNVNSNFSNGSNRNLTQTFQVGESFTASNIFIEYVKLGTLTFQVLLCEVDDVHATNFAAGNTLFLSQTFQQANLNLDDNGVMEFKLASNEQVTLTPRTGAQGYAFRIIDGGTGWGFRWPSGPDTVYANGRSYYSDLNSIGDMTMAIDVPEPATMSMLAIGGLAMLRRRRRKA